MPRYNNPVPQILDDNGDPIVGAKCYFYEPGTTTLKTVYSDEDFATPIDNPVLSTSGGRMPSVFLNGVYKVVQKDADDVTMWTRDPVGEVSANQFDPWLSSKTYSTGDVVRGTDDAYYRSIQDSNQGNDPTSSPLWWELFYGVLRDDNDNEVLELSPTASAVNHVDITNAATGNAPSIAATGDDTNIDLKLSGKGTGSIKDANDDIVHSGAYLFYATQSGGGSYGAGDKIDFDTEVVDPQGDYDPTTNYRYTPSKAGYYYVSFQVYHSTANNYSFAVYKNGTIEDIQALKDDVDADGDFVTAFGIVSMNGTTDYIDVRTIGAATLGSNAKFSAHWIAPN